MNYNKIYQQIILYRQFNIPEGYTEKHHIIPKSCGGSNNKSNLVILTAKEHYICHHLLTKIYPYNSSEYYKMIRAFNMMCSCHTNIDIDNKRKLHFYNASTYAWLKKELSKAQSLLQKGSKNSQYNSIWITNYNNCICKKIYKSDIIPLGYTLGKCTNFLNYFNKKKHIKQRKIKHETLYKQKLEQAIQWYMIYNEKGFKEFCKETGYQYSVVNLCNFFKKYYPNWKSSQGKRHLKDIRKICIKDDENIIWQSKQDII